MHVFIFSLLFSYRCMCLPTCVPSIFWFCLMLANKSAGMHVQSLIQGCMIFNSDEIHMYILLDSD